MIDALFNMMAVVEGMLFCDPRDRKARNEEYLSDIEPLLAVMKTQLGNGNEEKETRVNLQYRDAAEHELRSFRLAMRMAKLHGRGLNEHYRAHDLPDVEPEESESESVEASSDTALEAVERAEA